jgi:tryptophan synthase alpha chain
MSMRYDRMFERLRRRSEGAFVPFAVLGDPEPATSLEVLESLVEGGADALELGIAYSDPLADGPTIQAAAQRALASGVRPRDAWALVREMRQRHPALPMGVLVYANLLEAAGVDAFYAAAAEAGLDSVLVADVPALEAVPYVEAARNAGVCPVLIATPHGAGRHLQEVARLSAGYTYVVTRAGVTGADAEARTSHTELIGRLAAWGAPPCLLGFGISRPEHVTAALACGAAGAISGSAVVSIIAQHLSGGPELQRELVSFVSRMKAATGAAPG